MNEAVHFLAQHGYWLMVGVLLGRQACLPIPANLVLVAAGALAHLGNLNLSGAVGLAVLSFLLADREVVLYCACSGEFTSVRVALALKPKGIDYVRPLAGGLQAWRDPGFPVTSDVRISQGPVVHGRAPIDAPKGA